MKQLTKNILNEKVEMLLGFEANGDMGSFKRLHVRISVIVLYLARLISK